MAFGEMWGTLSVNDHVEKRALVAQVLLFDRLVVPVPPKGDAAEENRWAENGWKPQRQRSMLDILGVGPTSKDLAVTVPWTQAKRDEFKALNRNETTAVSGLERSRLVRGVVQDIEQLKPDGYMLTRMMLTRGYDSGEDEYAKTLPRTWVQAVVPAYASYAQANAELAMDPAGQDSRAAMAEVIGWQLFVPEDSEWTDEHALEAAAKLARTDDYRLERETFRDWWRQRLDAGGPPDQAVAELARRAERLNSITRANATRTAMLHGFAALGAVVAIGGTWFPPAVVVGGFMTLVSVGADWVLRSNSPALALAPAAMFADARKHLGWN